MVEVIQVPGSAVAAVWPSVRDYLAPSVAMSLGCFTDGDVMAACEAGAMTLFVAVDEDQYLGAVVCEVRQFPRRRANCIVFAGGREMRRWYRPMEDAVSDWSRAWGCTLFIAQGRRGWSRVAKGNEMALLWRDIGPREEVH